MMVRILVILLMMSLKGWGLEGMGGSQMGGSQMGGSQMGGSQTEVSQMEVSQNEKVLIFPKEVGGKEDGGGWKVHFYDGELLKFYGRVRSGYIFDVIGVGEGRVILRNGELEEVYRLKGVGRDEGERGTELKKRLGEKKLKKGGLKKGGFKKKRFKKKRLEGKDSLKKGKDSLKKRGLKRRDEEYEYIKELHRRGLYGKVLEEIDIYMKNHGEGDRVRDLEWLKGEVYEDMEDWGGGIKWYKSLILGGNVKNKGEVYVKLGDMELELGNWDEGVMNYIHGLRILKDRELLAKVYYKLGLTYQKKGEVKKSIGEWEKLVVGYEDQKVYLKKALEGLADVYYSFKWGTQDYHKAYYYYQKLKQESEKSFQDIKQKEIEKRLKYIEDHFIEYY